MTRTVEHLPSTGLEAFLAIARHGSIRAAAASLRVQPSTISHQLKAFEERLGVPLFVRTTRSISLTDAGQVLLQTAAPAVASLKDALERTRTAGAVRKGTLRLNMPYVGYRIALAGRLAAFQARYPDIDLEISLSDRFVDIVAAGFHAGMRFGGRVQEDMIAVPLTPPLPATVIAAPDYLATHGVPQVPADLLRHNCIRYRFISSRRIADWDFEGPEGHFTVDVTGRLVTDSLVAMVDSVAAGNGLAHLVTRFVERQLDTGTVVRVLERFAYTYPALYLYYPRENRRLEILKLFTDFFRAR